MQDIALQLLVVVMMLAVGFDLRLADLAEGSSRARWFGLALGINLIAYPLAAWFLADRLDLTTGLAAGLVLCAAAPGGPVGPVLARLGNADLAFSTALMVLLGVIGLVSAPLTVSLLLDAEQSDGLFWPMFRALLFFQILPLAAAMALRHRLPSFAAQLAKPARLISNLLLAGIVVGLLVTRGETLGSVPFRLHVALVLVVLAVLAPGLRRSDPGSIVRGLTVVTAVRNMSVALLLASRFFDDPEVEVAILVWAWWMIVLPAAVGLIAGRWLTLPTPVDATLRSRVTG